MIHIKHTGIFVKDIEMMTDFYSQIFDMRVICRSQVQDDGLTSELYGSGVKITKLITQRGCETGVGDMIELVFRPESQESCRMHVAFGIHKIENLVDNIKNCGGKQKTSIYSIGDNKVCFCLDPEGNMLELIENGEE